MITHLLFDLDNTLYPASDAMDTGITTRMMRFVSEFLNLPLDEAKALRSMHIHKYSTTLEWLMSEKNLTDTNAFFNYVHPESELNELTYDSRLRSFLQSLNMPMSVLSNSPMRHAQRVLDFYNIADLFIGVYDLECMYFKGKPHRESYEYAVTQSGYTIENTLFVDDHPKYVKGYVDIGGEAVLIDEYNRHAALPYKRIPCIYDIPSSLVFLQQ